jgi:serine protease Do
MSMLRRNRVLAVVIVLSFLLGAVVVGGAIYAVRGISIIHAAQPSETEQANKANVVMPTIPPGFGTDTVSNIVDNVGSAVVKIDTEIRVSSGYSNPFFNDPFFQYFFGPRLFDNNPKTQIQTGVGSGFIFSKDGYILTNEHVIGGADKIKVTVEGFDKPFEAKVVGADHDLDLAIIKIDAGKDLPYLKLGDSDNVKVGSWVIAIGNPYGLDHTVTVGVISAKGRPVYIEDRSYENLLQTDASINPGNSGGPLLNLEGEVIGINTAINAAAQGIGFAIPTSTIKGVQEDLMEKGKIIRPWIGVGIQDVTPDFADYLGLEKAEGAIITTVYAGSPAEKAGLRRGDVILEMDKKAIKTGDDVVKAVQNAKIGQKMVMLIQRGGSAQYLTVTIAEKPASGVK